MKINKILYYSIVFLLFSNANSQVDTNRINNFVDGIVEDYTIFGGAIAILEDNEVVYERYFGESNLDSHTKINDKTLFQIFSTTKIFSATAIHQLIQKKKLSLDAPIKNYLKDVPSTWQNVTIENLLTHSSGLPDIRFYVSDTEDIAKHKVYKDSIQFEKGEQFAYNQTNFWLLGRIVHSITKKSITDVIESTQFKTQNKSMVFDGSFSNLIPDRAINYAGYGPTGQREVAKYNIAQFLHGASGLNLSLKSFIDWDKDFFNGNLINNASKNRLFTPFNYKSPHDFAFGWDMVTINGKPSYGFTGSGFTGYRIFPVENVSIILLTNGSMRQMPINGFINELANLVTENQSERSNKELITATLMDYIEGTAEGQPNRLINAFHKDMNLYSVENDTLKVLSGTTYTGYYRPGQKRNRIGKIISIDFVNDAAIAKLEIDYPSRKTLYTDYLLLLKVKGRWKIIQKGYTSEKY